jgi:hypothetical protein
MYLASTFSIYDLGPSRLRLHLQPTSICTFHLQLQFILCLVFSLENLYDLKVKLKSETEYGASYFIACVRVRAARARTAVHVQVCRFVSQVSLLEYCE